ncbi:MAG: hypothetical protein U1F43_36630 [Myxococcota bacterium]
MALFACDGPGGGGGTTVDCSKTPNAPICRGDASNGDATTNNDTTGTACNSGARTCEGGVPKQCQNGNWVALTACTATQTCTNGICEENTSPDCCADMECGTDCGVSCGTCSGNTHCVEGTCEQNTTTGCTPACTGNTHCVDGTCEDNTSCTPQCGGRQCGDDGCGSTCGTCGLNKTCQNGICVNNQTCSCNGAECGEDNCGNSCGTCSQTQTCQAGQCVDNGGGGDACTDIIDCVFADTGCAQYTDDTQFQTCADTCYGNGSATGQAEFDAYVGCANTCGNDDLCFAANCSDEQAACFFDTAGTGSCFDILDCFDTCPANDDGTCAFACYEASTSAAQAALLSVNNCLDAECPDATSSDDPCYDTAIAGACAGEVSACQNN